MTAKKERIHILIADDHQILAEGLRRLDPEPGTAPEREGGT